MKWELLERKFWPVLGVFLLLGMAFSAAFYGFFGLLVTGAVAVLLGLGFKCTALLVSVITGQNKPDIITLFLILAGKFTVWVLIGSAPFIFPRAFGWPYVVGCAIYLLATFVAAFIAARPANHTE